MWATFGIGVLFAFKFIVTHGRVVQTSFDRTVTLWAKRQHHLPFHDAIVKVKCTFEETNATTADLAILTVRPY
jgi:hypothetical protein